MDQLSNLKKILSMERPVLQGRSYLNYDKGKTFRKSRGAFNVCVVYANTYDIGMSNLGFHVVCEEFGKLPDVQVDRAFMPDRKNEEVRGCVTGRKLSEFDMVAFSIPYEPDYLNIAQVLRMGGIEPLRENRSSNVLVACGGIAPSLNPYAVSEYMDLVFIGDAEILIPAFYENLRSCAYDLSSMERTLSGGFYFPSVNNKYVMQKISSIDKPFFSTVITANTSFADTVLIDAGRGCMYSCKFCITGNYLKPGVNVSADAFYQIVDHCSAYGIAKYGIISSCIGRIPGFAGFLKTMIERSIEINVSSLRFEDLDGELIKLLYQAGQKVFTLAPEAGAESLRFAIGKPVRDDTIIEVINKIITAGANIKLYFMIGLPGETEQDLYSIVDLVGNFKNSGRNIKANIQPFVPKPHTPFAREAFVGEKEIKRRFAIIKKTAEQKGLGRGIFTYPSPKESAGEYALSWKGLEIG
jgi:radical SAM superfamily enzyme YgiQ (UPF0313 family)